MGVGETMLKASNKSCGCCSFRAPSCSIGSLHDESIACRAQQLPAGLVASLRPHPKTNPTCKQKKRGFPAGASAGGAGCVAAATDSWNLLRSPIACEAHERLHVRLMKKLIAQPQWVGRTVLSPLRNRRHAAHVCPSAGLGDGQAFFDPPFPTVRIS